MYILNLCVILARHLNWTSKISRILHMSDHVSSYTDMSRSVLMLLVSFVYTVVFDEAFRSLLGCSDRLRAAVFRQRACQRRELGLRSRTRRKVSSVITKRGALFSFDTWAFLSYEIGKNVSETCEVNVLSLCPTCHQSTSVVQLIW